MQVFTSIIVLSVFFGVFLVSDINEYKQRKIKSLNSLAQVVGTNTIPTLQFQDNLAAGEILTDLRKVSPEIIYSSIIDKNGKLFAYYSKPNSTSPPDLNKLNGNKYEFTKDNLFVFHDIIENNNEIGKVILGIDLTEINTLIRDKYKIITVLLIVAILLSFLIAIFIQRYISKRLLKVVNTMKDLTITENFSSPIIVEGNDEISTLVKVFNDLMQQIDLNIQKKDEFIAIASHELKTPLTSIKGYIELLQILENNHPQKEYIDKTLLNINKLEKLIRDLLDVSKIQSGQLELNISEFDILQLIDETIATFQALSKKHSIQFESNISSLFIYADKSRLEQVILNLLSNAIKYSPEEDKVLISCNKIENEIIFKIRDFGRGIAVEEHKSIFNRFYRTRNSVINISGFGLGLYICKDIITRHKGKIWIESESKGSSFYFSIPLNNIEVLQD